MDFNGPVVFDDDNGLVNIAHKIVVTDSNLLDDDTNHELVSSTIPVLDGHEIVQFEDTDLHYDVPTQSVFGNTDQPTFKQHIVIGNTVMAVSMLVAQACFQTSSPSTMILPMRNVTLFLYLSKLVL